MLHQNKGAVVSDCPVRNATGAAAVQALKNGLSEPFPERDSHLEYVKIPNPAEAYRILKRRESALVNDTLIHGDYCLPNIIFKNNFKFGGFVDLGGAGLGDIHYDIYWGCFTLRHNLHTDKYKRRFLDAYGRRDIYNERLTLCGIISAFTN
jgi:kanamycin kinase